jgi:hypothetical protein
VCKCDNNVMSIPTTSQLRNETINEQFNALHEEIKMLRDRNKKLETLVQKHQFKGTYFQEKYYNDRDNDVSAVWVSYYCDACNKPMCYEAKYEDQCIAHDCEYK